MTRSAAPSGGLDELVSTVRAAVGARVREVLSALGDESEDAAGPAGELLAAAASLLAGGKRMRAALGAIGLAAAPGSPEPLECASSPVAASLGAALELYQASALAHDDVIDRALTRRGEPAAHRRLAALHAAERWSGSADRFGESGAILLGDLLLPAAGREMARAARLADDRRPAPGADGAAVADARDALPVISAVEAFDAMTARVALGQYLDLRSEVLPLPLDEDPSAVGAAIESRALAVVRRKTAGYSVQQPLLIGASLGRGLDEAAQTALTRYGEEIGIAFQLRDDALGVFGDPAVTGKPAGDDLREGKRTVLIGLAWPRVDNAGRAALASVLEGGSAGAHDVARAAALLEDCGAREAHEALIEERTAAGLHALEAAGDSIAPAARALLIEAAAALTARRA